ncbi:cell adhesion molecule CEACAM7-like isoform X2 [Sander vitreus]
MVKCETALTSDEKERKMQSERNNSSQKTTAGQRKQTTPLLLVSREGEFLLCCPKRMSLKMAAVSTISLLLLCCFAVSPADSQDRCDYNAIKGESFVVPLSSKLEPFHKLQWKHNENIILSQRKGGAVVVGKKEDISENGSLILKNLKESDKGNYTPQLFKENGLQEGAPKSILLCIFDRVPKPKVTKVCSLPAVTFTCKVPATAKDLKFEWLQNNKKLTGKTNSLTLKAEEVEKDSFQCKVSNPASSETSDSVTQNPCYTNKLIFPEELLGINTWIIIGAGGGVVLVLIIVVVVCCVYAKRKKRMQLKDERELRLAWTNDQQHQHQHPHGPHHPRCQQQQPAGHTGPRQHRSKQHREQQQQQQQQHLRPLDPTSAHPQPSPRRHAQAPRPVDKTDDEQPPPLPQPRKKAAKIPRV